MLETLLPMAGWDKQQIANTISRCVSILNPMVRSVNRQRCLDMARKIEGGVTLKFNSETHLRMAMQREVHGSFEKVQDIRYYKAQRALAKAVAVLGPKPTKPAA
jgi:hypothetical protein